MKNPGKNPNEPPATVTGDDALHLKEMQQIIETNLKYFNLPPNLVSICDSWDHFHIDDYDDDRKQVTSDCTKLPIEDIDLFGSGLDHETLLTATCTICGKRIKASVFTRHIETRHGSLVSQLKNRHILQRRVNDHSSPWNSVLGTANNHNDGSYPAVSSSPLQTSQPNDDYSNGSVTLLNGNSYGSNSNHSPLVESLSSSSSSASSPAPKMPIDGTAITTDGGMVNDNASPIDIDMVVGIGNNRNVNDVMPVVKENPHCLGQTGTRSSPIDVTSSSAVNVIHGASILSSEAPGLNNNSSNGTNFTVLKGIYCGGDLSSGNQVMPLSKSYRAATGTGDTVPPSKKPSQKRRPASKSKKQAPMISTNQTSTEAISIQTAIESSSMSATETVPTMVKSEPPSLINKPNLANSSTTNANSSPVLVSSSQLSATSIMTNTAVGQSTNNLISRPLSPVLMPPPPSPVVPKKKLVLCKNREYDPDQHCGVSMDSTNRPCTRSLTCRTHMISMRRKVPGRSKDFDELLKDYKRARGMKERRERKPKATPLIETAPAVIVNNDDTELAIKPTTPTLMVMNSPVAQINNHHVIIPNKCTDPPVVAVEPVKKEKKRRSIKCIKIPVPGVLILSKWPSKQMNVKTLLKSLDYPMLQKNLVIPASKHSRENLIRYLRSKRNRIRQRQKIQERLEAKRNTTLMNVSLSLRKNSVGYRVLKRYPKPSAVQSSYRNGDFPVYFTTDSNRTLKLHSVSESHNHPLLTGIELDQPTDGRSKEIGFDEKRRNEDDDKANIELIDLDVDENPPKPKKFSKDVTVAKPKCENKMPDGDSDGSDMLLKPEKTPPPSKLVVSSDSVTWPTFPLNTQHSTNSEKNVAVTKPSHMVFNNGTKQLLPNNDNGNDHQGVNAMVKQEPVPLPPLSSSFPTKITLLPSREQHTTTSIASHVTNTNPTRLILGQQAPILSQQQWHRLAEMANANPEELRAQLQHADNLHPGLMQQLRANYRSENDIIENIKADLINSSNEMRRLPANSTSPSIDYMSIQNYNFDTETHNLPEEVVDIVEELEGDNSGSGQNRARVGRTTAVSVNGQPSPVQRTISSYTLNPSSNTISTAIKNRGFDLQKINESLLRQNQHAKARIVGNVSTGNANLVMRTNAELPVKEGTIPATATKAKFTAILNGHRHDGRIPPETLKTLNTMLSNGTFRQTGNNHGTAIHQQNNHGGTLAFVKNTTGNYGGVKAAMTATNYVQNVQTTETLKTAGSYTQIQPSKQTGQGSIFFNPNSGLQKFVILRQSSGNGEPTLARLTPTNIEHKPCSSVANVVLDQQHHHQQQQRQCSNNTRR